MGRNVVRKGKDARSGNISTETIRYLEEFRVEISTYLLDKINDFESRYEGTALNNYGKYKISNTAELC